MKRVLLIAALALAACGGSKQKTGPVVAAQGLPPANPIAVQRMVEGATAAKDPRMQTRAIALLREAIAVDPNLWEARFDLGVVLINLDFEKTAQLFLAKVPHLDREVFLGKEAQHSLYNGYEIGKLSTAEIVRNFNAHHQTELSVEYFTEAWNAMILQFPREKIELLQRLKSSGKKLFLLSNINELHAHAAEARFLELGLPFSFHSLFDKVYYSHLVGMRKPEPEIFQLILNENNLKPEAVIFVDDSLQHIRSARKLGIRSLHLADPHASLENLLKQG